MATGYPQRSVPDRDARGPARPAIFLRLARPKTVRRTLTLLEEALGRFGPSAAYHAPAFAGARHANHLGAASAALKIIRRGTPVRTSMCSIVPLRKASSIENEPPDLARNHEVAHIPLRPGCLVAVELQVVKDLRLRAEHRFAIVHFQASDGPVVEPLPNATFVGFTGTPLTAGDKVTRHVFGDYADVYDIRQSVADGATVPIYYEPRIVKLTIDEAGVQAAEAKIAEYATRDEDGLETPENIRIPLEELYGAPERLERVAKFVVKHWEKRRAAMEGKAMIVTMSHDIAARQYDEIRKLRPKWHQEDDATGAMKVVMTGGPDDPEHMARHVRGKAQRKAHGSHQGPGRRLSASNRGGHVAEGLRRAERAHDVLGQAAGRAQADAGDRPREPRVRREAGRPDRRFDRSGR